MGGDDSLAGLDAAKARRRAERIAQAHRFIDEAVGSALITYTNSAGVLVSQAGVGAAEPTRSGRIFVDESAARTGFAIVNPGAVNNSLSKSASAQNDIQVQDVAEVVYHAMTLPPRVKLSEATLRPTRE